jgi:hypothetical protein
MHEIDSPRPTPPPVRAGRLASLLGAAIVALSVLLIALIVIPSLWTGGEPAPETFSATGVFAASSASTASAIAVQSSPTAPGSSAAPVADTSPAPVTSPVVNPAPVVDPNHVATRVRVPDLHIDLAVVAPAKNRLAYPKCGVAMYLAGLHQPGEDGATYLYAHARAGMFLPIYERAIQRLHGGPKSMLGMSVEVFTSDNLRYRYTIEEVRVHQTSLDDAARARSDELWLQTSEGPRGTRGKTQVRAIPVDIETVPSRQAHTTPKPFVCG